MKVAATRSARRAALMRNQTALGASDTTKINKKLNEQDLTMIKKQYDLTLTPYEKSAAHASYCKTLEITDGDSARERALSAREYYRLHEDRQFYLAALEAADVLLDLIIDEQAHDAVPALKIGAMQKQWGFNGEKEKLAAEMAGMIAVDETGLWVSEGYQPTKLVELPAL